MTNGGREIVVVSPYRGEYGPRQVLEHVCLAVIEAGYQPVLAVPSQATITPLLEKLSAGIHTIDGLRTFPRTFNVLRLASFYRDHRRAARLIEQLARERRAVGIYSISEAILAASIAARRIPVPSVVHAIGMSIQSPAWGAQVYIRLLDVLSTRIVACSSAVADMFTSFGVADEKCTVVHNGISCDDVRASAHLTAPIDHDGPRVGMVAAFDPRKGHELFLQAAALIVSRFPKTRFFLLGGALHAHAESLAFERRVHLLIAELGLAEHVEFVGYLPPPNIYAWMRAMDVIVVPSRTEAFAHALLEAMVCEKAIVATRIEGNLDAFADGHSGVYTRRNPRDMASAVCDLLADPAKRARMGTAAADRVARYFDLSVTVPANAWVIEQVFRPRAG